MIFNPSLKHYVANEFNFPNQNVQIFWKVAVYINMIGRILNENFPARSRSPLGHLSVYLRSSCVLVVDSSPCHAAQNNVAQYSTAIKTKLNIKMYFIVQE